jgi:hypothetical protein
MNCRGGHRGLTRGEQTLGARRDCQKNARRQNKEQKPSNKERHSYTYYLYFIVENSVIK